jgi:hypothetical protein
LTRDFHANQLLFHGEHFKQICPPFRTRHALARAVACGRRAPLCPAELSALSAGQCLIPVRVRRAGTTGLRTMSSTRQSEWTCVAL